VVFSKAIQARLHYQHESIHDLIEGWTEENLKIRPNPDKWSPFENIVHLVAYQPAFIHRIKRIVTEDGPAFERYKAENDPLFYHFLKRPMHHIMDDFDFDRVTIVNTLSKLNETEVRKAGYHPVFGTMPLTKWTEFFLLHEAHHLFTIFKLTTNFSK
jgi:hypothetical protein